MTKAQDAVAEVLDALLKEGWLGAALVSRDGLPVVSRLRRPASEETLAAMSAAVLGASEAALAEWGDGQPTEVVVAGPLELRVLGVDDAYLLVTVREGQGKSPSAAREKLRGILR